VTEDFQRAAAGGLGMVLRELDDGRVIILRVFPDGVAARAGIQARAEVISIDGLPIAQAIKAVVPYTGPFSTPHNLRLEQLRFVARRPVGTAIQIGVRSADRVTQTFDLTAQLDVDGFYAANFNPPLQGTELPVEYQLLGNGIAKISVYSFSDDLPLTVALWERAIQRANYDEVDGLVVDIRQNGGGSGFLGDQLPAYFFDQEYVIGNRAEYSRQRGEFVVNPLLEEKFILPPAYLRYDGSIAVLISPDCASACESFAYAMTINKRAAIIGHTPTAGLGGSVVPIAMPDGASFNYTNSRSLGADGEINIEGKGVAPTVRVPLTEETVFAEYDVLLRAALEYLRVHTDIQPVPMTVDEVLPIRFDELMSGEVAPSQPVRYRLTVVTGGKFAIIANGTGATERGLVVRVLSEDGTCLLSESYALPGGVVGAGFTGLVLPANLTVLIEVASAAPTVSGAFTLIITEVR
jgi:C-terminal processing protease CtpA/Prc